MLKTRLPFNRSINRQTETRINAAENINTLHSRVIKT